MSLKEYVSYNNNILQPNFEIINDKVKKYGCNAKFIGLKKLSIKEITNQDVLSMYVKLRDDGYLWYDTKLENVGKDENDNLFLIDYGELIYINDLDEYNKNIQLTCHKNKKKELYEYYLNLQEQILKLKRYEKKAKKIRIFKKM